MKKRSMSGWVTVSGPPGLSCRSNSGTTEPVEPSTLPKRTATKRVRVGPAGLGERQRLARSSRRSAWWRP